MLGYLFRVWGLGFRVPDGLGMFEVSGLGKVDEGGLACIDPSGIRFAASTFVSHGNKGA